MRSNQEIQTSKMEHAKTANLPSKLAIASIMIGSLLLMVEQPITNVLKSIWIGSGIFLQTQWDKVIDRIGDDPYTHWAILPSAFTGVLYFVVGIIYTIMDVTGKPSFIKKYKIQEGINEPLDIKKLPKVFLVNLFNLGIVAFLVSRVFYNVMLWRGYSNIRQLPTFQRVAIEMVIHSFIQEMGLYYAHRMFHSKLFYKRFHKLHHEWTTPVAMTAFYVHPLEYVVSNLIPPLFSFALCSTHVVTAIMWLSTAIIVVLHTHSGYHFPILPSPESHDFHHVSFIECYGAWGLFDRIHGTDKKFRENVAYSRHYITTTLTPPKELHPDKK